MESVVQTRLRIGLVYQYISCRISGRNRYLGASEGEARNGRYAELNKHFLSDDKPCNKNSATNDDEGSGAWASIARLCSFL